MAEMVRHYLVIESRDLEVLRRIRMHSHELSLAFPGAQIADMIWEGGHPNYLPQYECPPGAHQADHDEIQSIFRAFLDHVKRVKERRGLGAIRHTERALHRSPGHVAVLRGGEI